MHAPLGAFVIESIFNSGENRVQNTPKKWFDHVYLMDCVQNIKLLSIKTIFSPAHGKYRMNALADATRLENHLPINLKHQQNKWSSGLMRI